MNLSDNNKDLSFLNKDLRFDKGILRYDADCEQAKAISRFESPESNFTVFTYKGYLCVVRLNFGSLTYCGYVSVPESNKLHGLDHEKKELDHVDIKCYGGLTFSGTHPLLYLGEERYWLGFDANHLGLGDFIPVGNKYKTTNKELGYRGVEFMKESCKDLVDSLISFESK